LALLVTASAAGMAEAAPAPAPKPNIVLILADDLGYGDVQCYNPNRGRIPTPNIDRLAAQGMRFSDAHATSGVCSPSRYGLLTGRYHWRTRLQSSILGLYEPPLISQDRLTLAGFLQQSGYHTAAIGKWHLGWDWDIPNSQRAIFAPAFKARPVATPENRTAWKEFFSRPIAGGPTTRGFDYYFGTDVPNWPPYCFIENDRTVGIPGEFLPDEDLRNYRASLPGPALPHWSLEGVLPRLTDQACAYIARRAEQPQPFFLYLPLTSPHTPLAVNREWQGRSGLNTYADLVMETDAMVGRVLAALEQSGSAEHTLVIFTSDNGCAPYVGLKELAARGHFPSGPLRGYKADAWEGGHRIPFIVRWPGRVQPGTESSQLVLQTDCMATIAEILGTALPPDAAEDSVSLLPLLQGGAQAVRQFAICQSGNGLFSMRDGRWKIIFGANGGGYTNAGWFEDSPTASIQLYDLAADLGETRNLSGERPEIVARLSAILEQLVSEGRSTPGPKQANDVPVDWKRFITTGAN
jgi:arylsulfatase A-like enzyme